MLNKRDRKYVHIFSQNTEIPMQVKKQADLAYSLIKTNNITADLKEYTPKIYHYKKRVVLFAAALTLVIGTTAYASIRHWGLNDFFAKSGKELTEQASTLIEKDVVQENTENALVNFKVREAICDNESIYVVLEAKPVNSEKYLLLPLDTSYKDPVINMGIEAKDGETIVEYSREANREMLSVNPSLSDNGKYIDYSADYTTEEDGTVVFILKGTNTNKTENIMLTCNTVVYPIDLNGNIGESLKDSFDFQLYNKSTEIINVYQMSNPTTVEGTGVVVDKVEISQTELGLYTKLTFHLAPEASNDMIAIAKDSLWFEYWDDNGKVWENGLSGIGSIEEISDGVFVQKNNFSLQNLPDTITVSAFDYLSKTRFGEVTLNK
ncbi:MAG: hypothetical protein K0R00_3641 [Herbinix sp.]|jgi:hypothetical protein|nr:hypothetical protein [Herbinix sp.]